MVASLYRANSPVNRASAPPAPQPSPSTSLPRPARLPQPVNGIDVYTKFVYTERLMKNVTLSADEALIEQARRRAAAGNTTLNEQFRVWLARYVAQPAAAEAYERLMARLEHVKAGGSFSRDEMNVRR